jgi:hypothetical protein
VPAHRYHAWFVHVTLGQTLAYTGRMEQAIFHMNQAMELYPESLEPGILKVQYQLARHDVDGARRTLEELKERDNGRRVDHRLMIRDLERYLRETDLPSPAAGGKDRTPLEGGLAPAQSRIANQGERGSRGTPVAPATPFPQPAARGNAAR